MGAIELPNGDVRHELFTLGVDNGRDYEPFINKKISVACGYFANGKTVVFYPAKGVYLLLSQKWDKMKKSELGLPTRCFFFLLILLIKVGTKID